MTPQNKMIEVRGEGRNHLLFRLNPETLEIEIVVDNDNFVVKLYDLISFSDSDPARLVFMVPVSYPNENN